MRNIIFGLFVIIILFGTTKTYAQCDCANAGESESDEIKRSDAAFVGEVIKLEKINSVRNSEYKEFDVTFKIKKSLKDDSIKIITTRNITSGDSDFEIKEDYMVFAIYHNDNLLAWIGCCTSTRKMTVAIKVIEKSTSTATESRKSFCVNNGSTNFFSVVYNAI